MQILLASSNPHKVEEIRSIFAKARADAKTPGSQTVTVVGLDSLGKTVDEPVEDGPTFAANALLKARYYAHAARMICLADDSGLEVDALAGEPGVRSARFAGMTGPRPAVDLANNRLLLEKLRDIPLNRRTARFVCEMALVRPLPALPGDLHQSGWDVIAATRGTVEGRIILPEQAENPAEPWRGIGGHGFGYDPLFFVPHLGCTAAQLTPEQKNAISHRGSAARQMWHAICR